MVYSIEVHDNDQVYYPFGDDAIDCIIYDEYDRMAVRICRKIEKFCGGNLNKLCLA